MTLGVRAIAWSAIVAGVVLGREGSLPPRELMRHGDAVVLAVDFHVHSFPGDGSMTPWDLAVEAQRRGLDAIALTNHNHRLQWMLTQALQFEPHGALLIPGEELTSIGYHMAVAGTERNVAWHQAAADAAARIHDQGGIAIAAHPAGKETTGFDDRAIDVVDGVEAAHPLIYVLADGRRDLAQFYARARARRPYIAAIGSTDYHFFAPVGLCRTFVFARERSVAAAFASHVGVLREREELARQSMAAQQLDAANRTRTALLAAVSHDLRTPLAGLRSATETLATHDRRLDVAERQELLAAMGTSIARLTTSRSAPMVGSASKP